MLLISVAATMETVIAQPTLGIVRSAPCPCPMQSLDWRKCKSAPCFANTDSVPFLAKHDIVTITMTRVQILSMSWLFITANAHQKHKNQPGGRARKNKSLLSLVFSLRYCISSYPNSLSFACSFLVRRFRLICTCFYFFVRNSRRPRQGWAREKRKTKKLVTFSFSFLFEPPFLSFSNTPVFLLFT